MTRRTGKGEADVIVEHDDLAHCARVLELENRLLLDAEDDNVLPADAHSTRAATDGLVGIFDLRNVV